MTAGAKKSGAFLAISVFISISLLLVSLSILIENLINIMNLYRKVK